MSPSIVLIHQNIRIPLKKEFGDPPSPHTKLYLARQMGNFKGCPRVLKLGVLLVWGWGRSFKVTLQIHALNFFDGVDGGEQRVKRVPT